jgi:hypothetical protein
MSDLPTRVGGAASIVSTAKDAAREAGGMTVATASDVDELAQRVAALFMTLPIPEHHRAMAKSKGEEMFFWIKAGLSRQPE